MRDILIKNALEIYPVAIWLGNFRNLIDSLRPGTWLACVPIDATPKNAVNIIVDQATTEGWLPDLVDAFLQIAPNNVELRSIRQILDAQPAPTTTDPFQEVLLEGNRPFVNRKELREHLRTLCSPAGTTLLLVSGERMTGKTYSFYLAQHVARQQGFITSQFEVNKYVQPNELACEILERIGVTIELRAKGNESAERWAEKLAAQVKDAIIDRKMRRFLVFDEFPIAPQPPLPPETISFIVRLAKYADEELRPWLRVLLIQFAATLPPLLDDMAEREEIQPFTGVDMLEGLQQIAKARGALVTELALQTEIEKLDALGTIPLRERFQFLKRVIKRLKAPVTGGPT